MVTVEKTSFLNKNASLSSDNEFNYKLIEGRKVTFSQLPVMQKVLFNYEAHLKLWSQSDFDTNGKFIKMVLGSNEQSQLFILLK